MAWTVVWDDLETVAEAVVGLEVLSSLTVVADLVPGGGGTWVGAVGLLSGKTAWDSRGIKAVAECLTGVMIVHGSLLGFDYLNTMGSGV